MSVSDFLPSLAGARLLFDFRGAMALHVELRIFKDSFWVSLTADADEHSPVLGYLRFERVMVSAPGLSTYRVAEVTGPQSPPPSTEAWKSIFPTHSLEAFEFAQRARSASMPVVGAVGEGAAA